MELSDFLKDKRIQSGLKQREVADMLGLNLRSYQHYEEGRSEPKRNTLIRLSEILNFDMAEIYEQNVPQETIKLAEDHEPYTLKRRSLKNGEAKDIPVYYGNTRAGTIEVYSDDPVAQEPVGALPARLFPGCNHAERVTGDSMYPLIINQGLVIGKVINKAGVMWGEKYGIHTKYGQSVIKYLHPSEKPDCIRLVSHNKTVPPQDILIDDITFCFRVYYIVNPS